MNKVFILLPHKDQFLKNNSGSASIWVKDFFKLSEFKKKIEVYGSTENVKDVSIKKIYHNISFGGARYQS